MELHQLNNKEDGHLIHLAAARAGSIEALTYLAQLPKLINITDNNGRTAVMIAFENKRSINTIKLLLSVDPDPTIKHPGTGQNLLHLLLKAGRLDDFDRLSKKHPSLVWQRDNDNINPISIAVGMGHISWPQAEERFGNGDVCSTGASCLRSGQPAPTPGSREPSQQPYNRT